MQVSLLSEFSVAFYIVIFQPAILPASLLPQTPPLLQTKTKKFQPPKSAGDFLMSAKPEMLGMRAQGRGPWLPADIGSGVK